MTTHYEFFNSLPTTNPMPLLFIGHGNPMNAIELNSFSKQWQTLGNELETPAAILCISAHWETQGTSITAMDTPKTIHDFYGFPDELFQVQYHAPGHPQLASAVSQYFNEHIQIDHNWGLDHGAWSIFIHMYPQATIPVLQLSLDRGKSIQDHFKLAQELAFFTKKRGANHG